MTVLIHFNSTLAQGSNLRVHFKNTRETAQAIKAMPLHRYLVHTWWFHNYAASLNSSELFYRFPITCLCYVITRATKYLKNVITQKEIIPFRWAFSQFNLPLILPSWHVFAPSLQRLFNKSFLFQAFHGRCWTPRPGQPGPWNRSGQVRKSLSLSYYFGVICLDTRWWSQPCTTRDKPCRVLPL